MKAQCPECRRWSVVILPKKGIKVMPGPHWTSIPGLCPKCGKYVEEPEVRDSDYPG
jgi:endogenous inhibitor of DNA gyrase (YacG/DUF329 family)